MSILKHFDASKYLMKVLQVSIHIFINNLTLIYCWTRKKEEKNDYFYFYLNFDFEDADDNVDTNNKAVELIASLSCKDDAQQEKQEKNFVLQQKFIKSFVNCDWHWTKLFDKVCLQNLQMSFSCRLY